MSAVYTCQAETDDMARLACFDRTVSTLRAANASGDLVALSRDEVETVERDAFGFNMPSLPRLRNLFGSSDETKPAKVADAPARDDSAAKPSDETTIDRVTLQVDRWETSNQGRYRFHLTNGQIWVQSDTDRLRRPRKNDDGVVEVEIRKAALGTFLLKVNGSGPSIRVQRLE